MKYVALFRGINVGGKNVVKMNDLGQLLLDLGMSKVKTYIQSGNAVFETNQEEEYLQEVIQTGFMERFGFESNVLIRSIDEMRIIVERFPFSATEIAAVEAEDPKVEHLYVYFLDHVTEESQIDAIYKEYVGPDILSAGIREVYLLCHQSIRNSKLAIRASKVLDTATVRNWNTVNKLYDMLNAL